MNRFFCRTGAEYSPGKTPTERITLQDQIYLKLYPVDTAFQIFPLYTPELHYNTGSQPGAYFLFQKALASLLPMILPLFSSIFNTLAVRSAILPRWVSKVLVWPISYIGIQ